MDLMTLGHVGAEMIPIVAIIAGVAGGTIIVTGTMFFKAKHTKQREQSRREIAAYIAEGSMTPADGERILKAGEV